MNVAYLRFYEELNDFLPAFKRKEVLQVSFHENPSVKSIIEGEHVPHTEVDLILVNGRSVSFNEKIKDGDHISVYPVFESMDLSPVYKLRPKPLRQPKFALDVHLGKLARYLRILGFDTLYRNDYTDAELSRISAVERRCILTRDVNLLMRKEVERGYWVRNTRSSAQLVEVLKRFDLQESFNSFTFCTSCNGKLVQTDELTAKTVHPHHRFFPGTLFYQCETCHHLYWNGSHSERFMDLVHRLLNSNSMKKREDPM